MKFPDIPIIIISLRHAVERREKMRGQMERLGLSFRFFDACTPDSVPEDLRPQFFDAQGRPHGDFLIPGEIGCYASHLSVMRMLADGELREPMLVLEDDAVILESSPARIALLADYMRRYPGEIEYVNLFHMPFRCPQEKMKIGGGLTLVKPFYPTISMAGYMLTRAGAQKILQSRKKRILPSDVDVRFMALEDLNYWEPDTLLVFPEDVESTIDPDNVRSSQGRKKKRKGLSSKDVVFTAARRKYGTRAWLFCWLLHKVIRKPWLWLFPPRP